MRLARAVTRHIAGIAAILKDRILEFKATFEIPSKRAAAHRSRFGSTSVTGCRAEGIEATPAVEPGSADRAAARIRLNASQSIGFCLIVRLRWRRVRASVARGQPRAVAPVTWS